MANLGKRKLLCGHFDAVGSEGPLKPPDVRRQIGDVHSIHFKSDLNQFSVWDDTSV